MDATAFVAQLRRRAVGEVRSDAASRELYACDASLYRRLPLATLRAREGADLEAALEACRDHGVPLTMRGAGTSLAGQTVGPGLVVDCSALGALAVDPDARTARVGPGVVLDRLNAAARAHGLLFGPDVATASRATLGGMIANNSAGARSIAYGLTADHVLELEVLLADGTRAILRRGDVAPPTFEALRPLAGAGRFPRLLRRVSGYNLDALAGPEPDWPRLIAGSEGTLALIQSALVRLVERPQARGLALLTYASVDAALEATVGLLEDGPSAIELMDRALLDPANRASGSAEAAALAGIADGAEALLMVEHSGPPEELAERLRRLAGARVLLDPAAQAAVWSVRRSGIARALGQDRVRAAASRDALPLPFIEDPAVPPERLPAFARGLRALLDAEDVPAVVYGHVSVGCLHVRPLMDLRQPGGLARLRRIAEGTADLVVANGGSLSGEHGDGRARSELLPRMYPPETIAAFNALKRALDPAGLLNPGVIVDPDPLDAGLRPLASPPPRPRRTAMRFGAEGGLDRAARACNRNGACRRADGVMCPSFQALGDERHATRGRAVILRAALEGGLPAGLADDGLHEALELCLGCKACKTECPAGVDMARLKVEALAHRHRARGTPLLALGLGNAHALLALGSRAPALAALAGRLAGRLLGVEPPRPARAWRPPGPSRGGRPVALVADTFTRYLHPDAGDAAVRVLTAAGASVEVVDPGCCGRALLSQGLVAAARRTARRALDRLAPHALAGRPLVVLEPSCWSMLTDDLPDLVPDDPRARWVAEAAWSFERAVLELGGLQARPAGETDVLVHAHCHARALGGGADALEALRLIPGAVVRESGAGCCGMAGAFGLLHPELSRRIAEDRLAPAARAAGALVAAGSSCRAQLERVTGRPALHPAEHLAAHLP